ncbi:MAG: hypothetical protein L3J71_04700 [Victivallaceae bacterium]|nr:hypothetical protein [Victivallaceae bacterium]
MSGSVTFLPASLGALVVRPAFLSTRVTRSLLAGVLGRPRLFNAKFTISLTF